MQTTGLAPLHVPALHVSVCVHELPSLQAVPSAATGFEQTPLVGLQVPATWHESEGWQTLGKDPVQTPAWHESDRVQALPSSQRLPFGTGALEQAPVVGLHVPPVWHTSVATHVTGLDPMHTPALQVSVRVQASPSLQAVPSGLAGLEQVPMARSQAPAVWH